MNPAGVICEIMNEDGSMARLPDLVAFAQRHALKIGQIRSQSSRSAGRNESVGVGSAIRQR